MLVTHRPTQGGPVRFDPAIAAQRSFQRAQQTGELGDNLEAAIAAEATFSTSAGAGAKAAYLALQQVGEQYPDAVAFQEFLIYITWQQVTEEISPVHFRKGAELCDRYLHRHRHETGMQVQQIRELRVSFRAGLGLHEDEDNEYDEETFKGGD
jgi:hypothetical protein